MGRGKKQGKKQDGSGSLYRSAQAAGEESRPGRLLWQVSSQLQLSRGAAASHANLLAWTPAALQLRHDLGSHGAQPRPTEPLLWLVLLGSGHGPRAKLWAAGKAVRLVPGGRRDAKHQADFLLCYALPYTSDTRGYIT